MAEQVAEVKSEEDTTTVELKAQKLGKKLVDPKESIATRMQTCFLLKALGGVHSIKALSDGFTSKSALLKHEIAYVLGQMRDTRAIPYLKKVLSDDNQEAIVRHEAGEALAAIGDPSVIEFLQSFADHPCREIAETCQLAVAGLQWTQNKSKIEVSKSNSIDPAPSLSTDSKQSMSVSGLENIFLDTKLSLFERYRAIFALRDLETNEACASLCKGFTDDSALFKHEIAFVLGQMVNKTAVPALIKVLENTDEKDMVRHEAAEALGSIAGDEQVPALKKFQNDKDVIVSESCHSALAMHSYWKSDELYTV